MVVFWKAAAGVLITSILWLTVQKQEPSIALVLTAVMCCMVIVASVQYWEPVFDFMRELETIIQIRGDSLSVLFQTAGIALVSEIIAMLCCDAGNSTLGKMISMLGSSAVLFSSLPLLNSFLSLIQDLLGVI